MEAERAMVNFLVKRELNLVMMEEVIMQEMNRAASTAANPTKPRATASSAPVSRFNHLKIKWKRFRPLARVMVERSLPRRTRRTISKRVDTLCTKFRVGDALRTNVNKCVFNKGNDK